MNNKEITRSIVIPVLDFSPHSKYNIRTLLEDLRDVPGEVICIFNSREVYEELYSHPRIDKYCFNNLNAGVSRSWNIGINMAEGNAVFILNADIHVLPSAINELESQLFTLDNAVIVGPQGAQIDFKKLRDKIYYSKGTFSKPVKCDAISGFFFAIHRDKFLEYGLAFDVRFSPCFFEEWDIGLQLKKAGLFCYAVPVNEFEHHWGVSGAVDAVINYFGMEITRNQILEKNREYFIRKWHTVINGEEILKHKATTVGAGLKPAPTDLQVNGDNHAINLFSITGVKRILEFIEKIQNETYPEVPSEIHEYITSKMIPDLLRKYAISDDAKILDVGCGQGPALDLFREMGYHAIGITINDEDLRVCRTKGHDVHKMEQSFLSYPDSFFDLLWSRHCIEHSIFPYFTLWEFFRVLKPGGYIYIEVPAPNTACHHERNRNHYSLFGKEIWVSLIARTGFNLLEQINTSFIAIVGPDEYWSFIAQKPSE